MGHSRDETPDTWASWGDGLIRDVGGGVYYTVVADGIEVGGTGKNVWVWHWHQPDHPSQERWQISGCGLHTVLSVEPLTLDPSLACDEGCPNHGYIKNGTWSAA